MVEQKSHGDTLGEIFWKSSYYAALKTDTLSNRIADI